MVKIEDMGNEMDRIEGSLKALLKVNKPNKDELTRKLALTMKEMDMVKAKLKDAKKGVEAACKQTADAKKTFLHQGRGEGYNWASKKSMTCVRRKESRDS